MKKKNKKGFTLTELVAVVVILALIVLIAVPAYSSIRKKVLEQQYENTVSLIETAAAKYASEKKANMTIVQELIDKGLMETDDGTNIYDPRTNEVLNCYLVEIKYEKGNYNAEFTNVKSNSCRVENDVVIIAKNKETGAAVILEDNKWINYDLILSVDVAGIESTNINYRWTSSYGHTSTEASVSTNVRTILKTTYNVEVITNEEQYRAKQDVKIDKEAPIIKDIKISGGNDWATGREVTIKASDQNGSGIAGYYLGKTLCNESSEYQSNNKFSIKDSELYDGEDYYLCVKDKAGNVKTHEDLIHLELTDEDGPTCKIIEENDEWTNEDVTIKLGCEDSISGCDPNYSNYERTISETVETLSETWTIKDNAGNVTNCEETVKVYLDKTAPTCGNITGQSTTWTSEDRTLTQTCSDNNSGCSAETKIYSTSTDTATMTTTIKDAAGNTNTCSESVNVYVDKTAPTCGNVTGQSTTWTNSNRTLTQTCSDDHSGCSSETKTYSTSTKTATMTTTIKDAVGNTNTCSESVNVYVDKTGPTISFGTNGSNTYAANASTTVKATDSNSGVKSINYGWSTSSTSTSATYTTSSGTSLSSSCGISGTTGNCYLYVKACDNANNCNTARTNVFKIDRQTPTITKENITNANCITKHCTSADSTVCRSFKINYDSFEDLNKFIIHRSHCYNGGSSPYADNCDKVNNGVKYTAYNRLNNFLKGSKLVDDSKSTTNCPTPTNCSTPSCTKQFTFKNSSFGMCTTYNSSFSLQYAFKVCDPVGNCTGIISFTS